jgi:ATP adenylyltransferase
MNKYPYNNGHIMVVPKKHTGDPCKLSKEQYADLSELLRKALSVVGEVYKPQGFNLGMNLGKAAGAGIDAHIHYHIVPRWNGDTNFMPVVGEVKIISEHILESYSRIVEVFKK